MKPRTPRNPQPAKRIPTPAQANMGVPTSVHPLLYLLRVVLTLGAICITALGIVCLLILIQGQRDQARRVDAIVVLHLPASPPEHLEEAVRLYREGHAARVLLAGTSLEEAQAVLMNQGIPDEVLHLPEADSAARLPSMRQVAELASGQNIGSVLLVSAPHELLLDLKIASDLGLQAYGSPIPTTTLDMPDVVYAGLAYWRYVLLER